MLVAIAQFSFVGIAVHYVLPVLWTTSRFHTLGPMGEWAWRYVVRQVLALVDMATSRAGHWPLLPTVSAGRLARVCQLVCSWRH